MDEQLLLNLDLIYSKIGYILACLSSYASLDLSKRISEINKNIYLIKKSIIDNKQYIDIRDVIKFREDVKKLNSHLKEDVEVYLDGHKIACLLFEVSTIIKIISKNENINEDMKEYLALASKYLYDCGRIVNIEVLYYDNKID